MACRCAAVPQSFACVRRVVVLTSTHLRRNIVRGHGTGSNHVGMEECPRKRIKNKPNVLAPCTRLFTAIGLDHVQRWPRQTNIIARRTAVRFGRCQNRLTASYVYPRTFVRVASKRWLERSWRQPVNHTRKRITWLAIHDIRRCTQLNAALLFCLKTYEYGIAARTVFRQTDFRGKIAQKILN